MAAETAVGRRADAFDRRLLGGQRPLLAHILIYVFVIVPFAALGAAIPWAWGWGMNRMDAIMAGAWYTITLLGITVGFHRPSLPVGVRHFIHRIATRDLARPRGLDTQPQPEQPGRHKQNDRCS
jgi:hypothetical protein